MKLRELLRQTTGLDLSAAGVERAVRERMQRLGLIERAAYAPLPGTPEFDALLDLVTVPESWMLRDPAVFETALEFVQRRLLSHPCRPVRVLSLPCAGGEEPYSMAMMLAGAGIGPALCRIDAVDLSQAALARARLGRYTLNAFRGAGMALRERWFRQDGDEYLIDESLRRYVGFSQGNLLTAGDTLGTYDLVFCRNLLIYFDDAARGAAVAAVQALLAEDGLLLSGYAEAPVFCRGGFAPQSLSTLFALRREPARLARAAGAQRPAPRPFVDDSRPRPRAEALQPAPKRAQALLAEAQRQADAGRFPEADRACRAVLEREPGNADAWFLLGMIAECCGQPQAAQRYWRRCLQIEPEHYEALCSLALLHELLGDSGQGAALRERAARVYRRRADAVAGARA